MRVGIIGAGQLGQMLGFAARELGIECRFSTPQKNPPAASAGDVIRAAFDDREALQALAAECDVLTYEFENVEVDALARVGESAYPCGRPSRLCGIRRIDSRKSSCLKPWIFRSPVIAASTAATISKRRQLALGFPVVVKTRRFGYDGKGQFVVRAPGRYRCSVEVSLAASR